MLKNWPTRFRKIPTPLGGLALGIASLGICWENVLPLSGWGQIAGALIATALMAFLAMRFVTNFDTVLSDIKHPVAGSILPTFCMATMIISRTFAHWFPFTANIVWLVAVVLHLMLLALFTYERIKNWSMQSMVPSWFIPPVGLIVADVSFPGLEALLPLAYTTLVIGLVGYAILLPVMLYRLIFLDTVPHAAKPTIAIMAAPASLALAGYVTVMPQPNLLLCAILLGIAVLMTAGIYVAFFDLLRLQFSPGYAAFTFPMAIGAVALFKLSAVVDQIPGAASYASDLRTMGIVELIIATVVIVYVLVLYLKNFKAFLARN